MSDLWTLKSGEVRCYRTEAVDRAIARTRRAELTAAGVCISGWSHGPATHGVLCLRCREQHRRSA